jgi:AcrR family transcriptional regulator
MAVRGSYIKGVAKREEILSVALEVVAAKGYGRATVRELAEAVGLTQAGLLHYFSSKEELFTEILRLRDERDSGGYTNSVRPVVDMVDAYVGTIRHNAQVPGLVQLFARLSAEATDSESLAHDYFAARYATLREYIATSIRAMQQTGDLPVDVDADAVARIFIAVSDGLQTQWLIEPNFEMADVMTYLARQLGLGGAAGA